MSLYERINYQEYTLYLLQEYVKTSEFLSICMDKADGIRLEIKRLKGVIKNLRKQYINA